MGDIEKNGLESFLKGEEDNECYDDLREIGNKIEPWKQYNLDFGSEKVEV